MARQIGAWNTDVAAASFVDVVLNSGTGASAVEGDILLLHWGWANGVGTTGPTVTDPGGGTVSLTTLVTIGAPSAGGSITSGVFAYVVGASKPIYLRFTASPTDDGFVNTVILRDAALADLRASETAWSTTMTDSSTPPSIANVKAGSLCYAGVDIASGSEVVSASGTTLVAQSAERKGYLVSKPSLTTPGTMTGPTFTWANATAYRPRSWMVVVDDGTPVAYKSQGNVAQSASGTSLSVPIPARVVDDYTIIALCLVTGTTAATASYSGSPYSAVVIPDGAGGSIQFLWRKSTGTEAAANQTVTLPASTASLGKASVWTGAGTAPPVAVQGTFQSATAYLESPTSISIPDPEAAWLVGLVYGAQTGGALSNNGTIVSTNTARSHETTTGAVNGILRLSSVTSVIESSVNGTIRRALGGAADNITFMVVPPRTTPIPALVRTRIGMADDNDFTIVGLMTDAAEARLKIGTNSGVTTGLTYTSWGTPDANGYVHLDGTWPADDTDYWYRWQMEDSGGGITESAIFGPVHSIDPLDFTLAVASCYEPAEEFALAASFSRVLARNPDLFAMLGDHGYWDNTSTSQASHRADMEAAYTASSAYRDIVATTPLAHKQGDHDAGGNTEFPGPWTAPNRAAARQVFPFPTLPAPDGIGLYYSFKKGRYRFIVTDDYTYMEDDGSTKLGATQMAWFLNELAQPEPVKVWLNASIWNEHDDSTVPGADDSWGSFPPDVAEISAFTNGPDMVGSMVPISGDSHSIKADDGTNTWDGSPTFSFAPFLQWSSLKTTDPANDWTEAPYPTTEDVLVAQYGFMRFLDEGTTMTMEGRGYDTSDTLRVSMDLEFPGILPVDGVAASVAPTPTQAAAGETDVPVFTGAAASVAPVATQNASGEVDAPTYTGSAASVAPAPSQAAAGTTSAPTFTGTAASVAPIATQTVTGTFTIPSSTGEATSTAPAAIQQALGEGVPPQYVATVQSVAPTATQSAVGDVDNPAGVAGSAQSVAPIATQAATGTYVPPDSTGQASSIAPLATQSAEGVIGSPTRTGTAASVAPAPSQSGTGTYVGPARTGEATSTAPAATQRAIGYIGDVATCWPEMSLEPVGPGSTLVPRGGALDLDPVASGMILVEDGCRM